ncbi:MAG: DUF554 domain-containing protein [Clostridia bacterium]|nr:DUF554 domain-containing protein [Clostridia bacterium]
MDKLLTFPYSGVIYNTLTVIVGSLIGLAFQKGFPKKLTDAVMCGIGLCTVYIGISGAVSAGSDADANPVMPIIAVALGVLIGTLIDIDRHLTRLGDAVERKFSKQSADGAPSKGRIAEGFVSACLLFCVGSMTIVGGINAGVSSDNTLYFTKGTLDFVSSIALSVSFGIGVLLSSVFVFLFQGGLVLAAGLIEPYLTSHMIAEMNCVGSLLIVIIGLNLIGVTKIKVANFLPAILIAMLLAIVM